MRHILAGWLGVVSLVAVAHGQEAVSLRPAFVEGRTTLYEFWSQRDEALTTSFAAEERTVNVKYTFEGRVTWRVAAVHGDGSAECEMTFDWFAMEVGAEGQSQSADSRKGSGEWAAGQEFAQAITGKTLIVQVNADGTIEKVDGIGAITSQLSGDDKNKPDETDFKENAASLAVLWAAPATIEKGETWNATFAWNHEMGTLNYKTTCTLDDVGELEGVPVAMVSSDSTLVLDFKQPDLPPNAPPLTMKFDGGEEYEQVIYDLSRGEAAARHMTRTLRTTQSLTLDQGMLTQVREETVTGQVVRVAEE